MASTTLTVTINEPASDIINTLLADAKDLLEARGYVWSSLTAEQKKTKYLAELLRDRYRTRKTAAVNAVYATNVAADLAAAEAIIPGIG